MPNLNRAGAAFALLIILLVAAALRFHGLDWDGGQHLHPDERFLAIVGDKIRLPGSLGGYFDTTRSPLSPYNQGFEGYAYGTGPLFLTRAIAELTGMAGYDRIHLLGRALSALADLGTIVAVFLLGRLVYSTTVGLLAAALLAVTVLHIQLSHFFAVDTFLAFFTTLGLYAAYRAWLRGRFQDYALLGIAVGLAASTKLSAVLLLPIVAIVMLVPPPGRRAEAGLPDRLKSLALWGALALLVYRLAEPYSFSNSFFGLWPNEHRFADLDRWVKISSGEIEVPFMVQWAGTSNPWFALRNLVDWGFGPVAGLCSLLALALAAVQMAKWPRGGTHLLLVVWSVLNLGYFGFQFAKFMRYFLPLYPALAVLCAWLLVSIARRAVALPMPLRAAARLAAPAVLAATALYAAMFSTIYARPNTRLQASEWIYSNVAPGATIATEHWDDSLPLRLPARQREYREISMELYDDESRAKATRLADNLARADYLFLSSNRLYGSIPRLPERFPIAVEYYRLLFAGELGFELAARFTSPPSLLGLTLDDGQAQEDFTVYDHPTVLIFKKSQSFDAARISRSLAAVSLEGVEKIKPVEAGRRHGLMLAPSEWWTVGQSGTWSERFSLDGLASQWPIVFWLVAVQLIALASAPICWWLFPGLPDRGFAVSKTIGLLLVGYLSWMFASVGVAPFGPTTVTGCLLLVAGVGCVLAARMSHSLAAELRARLPWIALTELLFLTSFGLMLGIRALNPDLWHPAFGGEKPMDFAYFNAILKSPSFPPYDPWFSGGYINYYYFGLVLAAVPTLLSAVPPAQAYNLAIPTIFAMTITAAFGFGSALMAGPRSLLSRHVLWKVAAAGLISGLALCILGNLDGAAQLRDGLLRLGGQSGVPSVLPGLTGLTRAVVGLIAALRGGPLAPFDFWRSTRFIGPEEPGPIHEFPYFTFLYGDLHAHMVALPLQVAVALVGLQIVRCEWGAIGNLEGTGSRRRSFASLRMTRVGSSIGSARPSSRAAAWGLARPGLLLCLAAVLIGALRATNTWDFPTYLGIAAISAVIALRPGVRVGWARAALVGVGVAGALYGLSSLFFLPYLARYELFYTGVVPVKAVTDLGQFLTIYGLLLVAVSGWVVLELRRVASRARLFHPLPRSGYYGVLAPPVMLSADARISVLVALGIAAALALVVAGRGLIAVALGYGIAIAAIAVARRGSRETLFVLALGGVALGALLLPEAVAVRGDVGRMNTVFKFYLQAWVLLSLLSGPAVVWTFLHIWRRGGGAPAWGKVWLVALCLLAGCAAIYPLRATPSKLALRFEQSPPTLDGMAFMQHARQLENGRDLYLADDYDAIRWMLESVPGTPVILEGSSPLYHWGSRFSIYTGLPSVLGWDWHQKQQRWGYQARVEQRQRDVKNAYETTDPETLREILDRYQVEYVVLGGVERAYYAAPGLEKFERMAGRGLEVAYRAGQLTIYRVTRI